MKTPERGQQPVASEASVVPDSEEGVRLAARIGSFVSAVVARFSRGNDSVEHSSYPYGLEERKNARRNSIGKDYVLFSNAQDHSLNDRHH